MKKAVVSLFVAIGISSASQAVVIHWAVSAPLTGTTSAQIVYVTGATPPAYGQGTVVGTSAPGSVGIWGVGDQLSYTGANPGSGNYFVMLFDASGAWSVSSTPLAYNNFNYVSVNELDPTVNAFNPSFSGGWTPIPEPTSMALFCFGAATMALRRRLKKRA